MQPIGQASSNKPEKLVSLRNFLVYLVNRSAASTPPYPVLPNVMTASTDSLRQQQQTLGQVRVLHAYEAQHEDELTIRPGRILSFRRFHLQKIF